MFQYILKRLLFFVPTLFIISIFSFGLSKLAPGDPVELRLKGGMQGASSGQLAEKQAGERAYIELSEKMGLNLPAFYFSLTSQAYPDTLYKIHRKYERETLSRLVDLYGNWPLISAYYHNLKSLENNLFKAPKDSLTYERSRAIKDLTNELYRTYEDYKIQRSLKIMDSLVALPATIIKDSVPVSEMTLAGQAPSVKAVVQSYQQMKREASPGKKYVPALHWYGTHNQYHRWLFGDVPWFGKNDDPTKSAKGFFRLDFGESYLDGRPVASLIGEAIKWTMVLNLISVLLSYSVSIPIGVNSAIRKGTLYDRITSTALFVFYSLPSFWIATLLVVFVTTSEYGMDFFPTYGIESQELQDAALLTRIGDWAYHLVLPVFCLTYASFAFISRQMRGAMVSVINQDYIRTANAKGLAKAKIVWKHAFRNSLIPIITMFASLFPLMISGSVIIEVIFQIPGMGKLSYTSLIARDYPVLFTILMFSAILTMMGMLVADLLYALVDPRISYTKKK
ncbi:MAG: ABC transporter permease subunit [Chitinophagales bacterium]|nr:ABC transporter permease subunit [Chitinophagales bacterium]